MRHEAWGAVSHLLWGALCFWWRRSFWCACWPAATARDSTSPRPKSWLDPPGLNRWRRLRSLETRSICAVPTWWRNDICRCLKGLIDANKAYVAFSTDSGGRVANNASLLPRPCLTSSTKKAALETLASEGDGTVEDAKVRTSSDAAGESAARRCNPADTQTLAEAVGAWRGRDSPPFAGPPARHPECRPHRQ